MSELRQLLDELEDEIGIGGVFDTGEYRMQTWIDAANTVVQRHGLQLDSALPILLVLAEKHHRSWVVAMQVGQEFEGFSDRYAARCYEIEQEYVDEEFTKLVDE